MVEALFLNVLFGGRKGFCEANDVKAFGYVVEVGMLDF